MRKYKLILLTVFYILGLGQSLAQDSYIEMMSKVINEKADSHVIREVCEHKYSNREINKLEKLANGGDNNAQLKLGIIYDIKARQIYRQIWRKNDNFDVPSLYSGRESPCDFIN
ncbi:hypothetical protein PT286_01870 [Neisseriaceae bacterium ESL0693]|nr:hypothetical protein [Neisseriaceae bacterium ESL0693]